MFLLGYKLYFRIFKRKMRSTNPEEPLERFRAIRHVRARLGTPGYAFLHKGGQSHHDPYRTEIHRCRGS